jgi:CubicO group peptidase (beta-lactamase class C family)
MKLVEEGTIKLNDPVTKYIPELNNIQTNGNDVDKITITSIMRHTTGLTRNVQ